MIPAEIKVLPSAAATIAARPEVTKAEPTPVKIDGIEIQTEDLRSRTPLAQLLHALNQPLTGLQCAMEVALAAPRSNEQYVRGLREGLELTERMRALVETIREVADGVDEAPHSREAAVMVELKAALSGVVGELAPVAEAKGVSLVVIEAPASPLTVQAGQQALTRLLFRLLESILSLAAQGSVMRIETVHSLPEVSPGTASIRIRWRRDDARAAGSRPLSRPELGLLVVQAGCERSGAQWERARTGDLESVTIRLAGVAFSPANP
jgi:signal transduction histidine kinase